MQILVLIFSTVYFDFGLLRLNTCRSKLSPSNATKQMWKHHPVRLFGRRGALHAPRLWDWSRSHGSSTNSHAWICPDTWFSYIQWIFATVNFCFWLAVLQVEEVKEGGTSVFCRVMCFFSFLVTGFQEWIDDEGEILSSSLQVVSWLFLYLVCQTNMRALALEQTTWCCLQTYCKRCILCSIQEAIGKREDWSCGWF